MGSGSSTSLYEYYSLRDPGCSMPEEEPWWERSSDRGRNPPSFAEYTRVYFGSNTSISKVITGLIALNQECEAHYMWCVIGDLDQTPYIEIWAHPIFIDDVRNLTQHFIWQCTINQLPAQTWKHQKVHHASRAPAAQ